MKRNSKLVKWAFWGELETPYETDTCSLFWRSVLLTPLKIAVVCVVIGVAAWAILYQGLWLHPQIFFTTGGIAVGGIVILFFIIEGIMRAHGYAKERNLCKKIELER